jgi:hypothetical protein
MTLLAETFCPARKALIAALLESAVCRLATSVALTPSAWLSSAVVVALSCGLTSIVDPPLTELVPESVLAVQLLFSISEMAVWTSPLALEVAEPLAPPEALAVEVELPDVELEPPLDKPASVLSEALALPLADVLPLELLPEALPLPPRLRLKASAGMLATMAGLKASSTTAVETKSRFVMLISADLVCDNYNQASGAALNRA